jgi:hypothetical protein
MHSMHAKFFELEDYEEAFQPELITLSLKWGGTLRVNRRWETKNISMRSQMPQQLLAKKDW